jgi:broad specificity phosphatase PhoE
MAQAEALTDFLEPIRPGVVVTSAMKRAIATALPSVNKLGIPHHVEQDLHERRVGAMCGQPFSLVEGFWADTLREWAAGNTAFTTPGAESFDDLQARLLPAWNRIVDRFTGDRIAVVAHGIVVKVLVLSLLPQYTVHDWVKVGRVANLAHVELVHRPGLGWHAEQLLVVPEPIARLGQLTPMIPDPPVPRSEA